MAQCLLVGALVAGVVAALLAFTPIRNPNVQDCGTALGFVVFNRTDVPIDAGAGTGGAAGAVDQATCRERVTPRLQQAMIAFGAFLALGLLGAVLGLLDDRLEYHRAPRFETLLRERPTGAPNLLRPPPVMDRDDVGRQLPPVELLDLVVPAVMFTVVGVVLVAYAGLDDLMVVIDRRGPARAVVTVLALVALAFGVAAAQLVLSHRRPLPVGSALLVSVSGSWLSRVLPALGPLGLDAHHLVHIGVDRDEAVAEQQVRQWLGLMAHVVLLVVVVVAGRSAGRAASVWSGPSERWWLPVGVTVVVLLVGIARARDRWRRLVVRPDLRGLRVLGRTATDVVRILPAVCASAALPLVQAVAFAVMVGWAGAGADFAPVAMVFLAASAVAVIAPTPAGVGLFEPVAVLGLVAVGVAPAPAVVAVVAFRLITVWAPMPVGAMTTSMARRAGDL